MSILAGATRRVVDWGAWERGQIRVIESALSWFTASGSQRIAIGVIDRVNVEVDVELRPAQMLPQGTLNVSQLAQGELAKPGESREWQVQLSLWEREPEAARGDGTDRTARVLLPFRKDRISVLLDQAAARTIRGDPCIACLASYSRRWLLEMKRQCRREHPLGRSGLGACRSKVVPRPVSVEKIGIRRCRRVRAHRPVFKVDG